MTPPTSDHPNEDHQPKDQLNSDSTSNHEGNSTTAATQETLTSSNVDSALPQSSLKRSTSSSEDGPSTKKKPRLSLRDRISQMGSSVMSSLLPSSSSGNTASTASPSSDTESTTEPVSAAAASNTVSSTGNSSSRSESFLAGASSRPISTESVDNRTDPVNNITDNNNNTSTPSNSTNSRSPANVVTSSSSSIMNNFINHLQNSNLHIPNHSIPSRPTATSIASLLSSPSPRPAIPHRHNALPPLLHRQSSRFFPTGRSSTDSSSTSASDQTAPPSSTPRIIGAPGPRVRPTGLPNTTTASGRDSAMEDQAAVLANLLAIAATATAHSLADNDRNRTGNNPFRRNMFNSSTPRTVATPTSFSNPTSVTSFDGFLAGLRNGLLTTELSNSLHDANQASPRRAMNFFRMFRFVNSDAELERTNSATNNSPSTDGTTSSTAATSGPATASTTDSATDSATDPVNTSTNESTDSSTGTTDSSTTDSSTTSNETGNAEPNLVPILIVGVRAVENNEVDSTGGAQPSTPTNTEPETTETTSNRNSSLSPQALRSRDALITAINERHGTNFPLPSETLRASSASNRPSQSPPTTRESPSPSFFDPSPPPAQTAATDVPQNSENQPRQSWIVYVFGGSYPENHPILLAPTLFSDNPSYEDLMTLEAFMGQVKPPIATKDEVEKSGGLFRVGTDSAVTKDGEKLTPDGRCQICLSDFESNEECRLLSNCKHVFHRECIDQWLTTGRNSCPLCRSEGVKKDKQFKPSVPTMPSV